MDLGYIYFLSIGGTALHFRPMSIEGHSEGKETLKKLASIYPAGLLPEVRCSTYSNLLGTPVLSLVLPLSLPALLIQH